MKFKLKGESEKEHTIELWLEGLGEDGGIGLRGSNGKGIKDLMRFRNGQFRRHTDAQLEGLKTDDEGRIEELKI